MAEAPLPEGELLTQLQDQLHGISTMFYDFVGSLQRAAPPASVSGEEIILPAVGGGAGAGPGSAAAGAPSTVDELTALPAGRLVEAFDASARLIKAIPDEPGLSEAAHLDRIRALQAAHAEAAAELAAAAAAHEEQLAALQGAYQALAAQRLRDAAAAAAADDDDGA